MIDSPKTGAEILKAQAMLDSAFYDEPEISEPLGPYAAVLVALLEFLECLDSLDIVKPGDVEYFQNPDYSECQDDD